LIIDTKATRSCLKKVIDLEGADVITVEGLATPDKVKKGLSALKN
jgi:aerobic-type carbon monoxide dehydrogenase small subunit (CoxS/CutS family)